jgi:hypothetical protein
MAVDWQPAGGELIGHDEQDIGMPGGHESPSPNHYMLAEWESSADELTARYA